MTGENARRWWNEHEAWIAVGLICASMFGAGWISGTITVRSDYTQEALRVQASYQKSMDSKDQLIARLANSTATSATQAVTASTQAATASMVASKAAGTAAQAAASASQAVDDKKTLRKLK